jgi:16S rRNA (guanine527-N7)-methyltransferase
MEEIEKLPSGWKLAAVHPLQVPALDEQRHLVEICRSHERLTPRAAAAGTAGDPSQ